MSLIGSIRTKFENCLTTWTTFVEYWLTPPKQARQKKITQIKKKNLSGLRLQRSILVSTDLQLEDLKHCVTPA